MGVRVDLEPGKLVTKGLLAKYEKRLICVRYRYDEQTKQRFKTAEVIVDQSSWQPEEDQSGEEIVAVRVGWQESELQREVKAAGGEWDPAERVWRLQAEGLEVEGRIVEEVDRCGDL